MANTKPITRIDSYVPADVPTLITDMPTMAQFLSDEFKQISYPIQQLTDDWEPEYKVLLRDATAPLSWTPIPQDLTDYTGELASKEIYKASTVIDLVAGTVAFQSDPLTQFLVVIEGSIIGTRVSGAKDESVFMNINIDGVDKLLGTVFVGNKSEFFTIDGKWVGMINGNSVLKKTVSYGGNMVCTLENTFLIIDVISIVTP